MIAGFDMGGTRLKYGLVTREGRVVYEKSVETPESWKHLLAVLKACWEEITGEAPSAVTAAGFGIPGIFNLKERKILQSPNYPGIDNVDLVPALSRFVRIPFFINNDANLAAYGEFRTGGGRNSHSLVHLTLGTGVGSGIILNGEIWSGVCGFAGELGHITVRPQGRKCNCGNRGCLETEVSSSRIVERYARTEKEKKLSSEEVFYLAVSGDSRARAAFIETARFLGIGLGIVINFLNPEFILLGGGVMEAKRFFFPAALKEASKRSYRASFNCCSIKKAELGNRAGFIGAALWAASRISGKHN